MFNKLEYVAATPSCSKSFDWEIWSMGQAWYDKNSVYVAKLNICNDDFDYFIYHIYKVV